MSHSPTQETYRLAVQLRAMLTVAEVRSSLGHRQAAEYETQLSALIDQLPAPVNLFDENGDR